MGRQSKLFSDLVPLTPSGGLGGGSRSLFVMGKPGVTANESD